MCISWHGRIPTRGHGTPSSLVRHERVSKAMLSQKSSVGEACVRDPANYPFLHLSLSSPFQAYLPAWVSCTRLFSPVILVKNSSAKLWENGKDEIKAECVVLLRSFHAFLRDEASWWDLRRQEQRWWMRSGLPGCSSVRLLCPLWT